MSEPETPTPRTLRRAVLLMLVSTLMFGSMAVAIRYASAQLHPFEIAFFRNLFGFVFGGAACSLLRSFVEHCAVTDGTRSAVVKAGPVFSLLFLNINLHHTHPALPDVAWYAIPTAHREMGSDAIAAEAAALAT